MIKNINIKIIKIISICFIIFYIFNISFVQAITIGTVVGKKDVGLNSGLVGWWTMDGKSISNGTVLDMSGNGRTGNLVNIATSTFYTTGKLGQGFNFNKINEQYVTVADHTSLDNTTTISFGGWFYMNDLPINSSVYSSLICKRIASNNNHSYCAFVDSVGNLNVDVNGAGDRFASTATFVARKWYHFMVVFDGNLTASERTKLYINGTLDKSAYETSNSVPDYVSNLGFGVLQGNTGGYLDGKMDDVRIYNRALSASEIQQLYSTGAETKITTPVGKKDVGLNSGLLGWWTMDGKSISNGTVLDMSGNGRTGNLVSIATSTFYTTGKIGQGFNFDGVNDYINLSSPSSFNVSKPVTVSVWVKPTNDSAASIYGVGDKDATHERTGFSVGDGATGTLTNELITVSRQFEPDSSTYIVGYTTANRNELFDGKWHLVTIVWDSTVKIYLDGQSKTVSLGNGTNNGTYGGHTGVDTVSVGSTMYNGTVPYNPFVGSLDDVRIYNRALSASEIQQLYNMGSETKITTPVGKKATGLNSGLVGWWTMDGKDTPWTSATAATTLDKSGSGNTGTLTNMSRSSSPVPGKLGQGLNFDGVDERINHTISTNLSNSFTVSAWVYPTKSSGGLFSVQCIVSSEVASYSNYWFCLGPYDTGTLKMHFGLYNGTQNPLAVDTNTITLNKWVHVVGVRDVTSDTVNLYVNGVLVNSVTDTTTSVPTYSDFNIGGQLNVASRFFGGRIDDARIYNRALSTSEVQQLYNMGR